jgi:hypothetical protein
MYASSNAEPSNDIGPRPEGRKDDAGAAVPRTIRARLVHSLTDRSDGRLVRLLRGEPWRNWHDIVRRKICSGDWCAHRIGYELAAGCARNGFDLLIAAAQLIIFDIGDELRTLGGTVLAVAVGPLRKRVWMSSMGRPMAVRSTRCSPTLDMAWEGFWDQNWINVRLATETNVTGTIYLLHKVGSDMRTCRNGRILTDRAGASWRPRAQANGPAQGSAATMRRPSNGRYRSTDHFERLV